MKKPRRSSEKQIKTVIFDLGNVLLNYNARKAAKRFAKGCQVPLLKVWIHFFTSPTEKAYTRGEISSYAFYRHAKHSLRFPVDYVTFRNYWNEIFWENPGMEALLKKLKKRYPLYLISNTNKMHFDHVKKKFPKMLRHFRRTFPSHEVGKRKPDVKIYKKVLKAIRRKPEEAVFIDDVPKFVKGARKAGMHAIRFRDKKQLIRDLRKLRVKV